MASPTVAANAYAALSRIVETGGAEKGGQSTGGPSFSAVLKDAIGSVMDAVDAGLGARPRHPVLRRHHENADLTSVVIASAAKQSMAPREERVDCFVARAPRNDEVDGELK
jgi:hypothetical protein